jgi:hypothetical protein
MMALGDQSREQPPSKIAMVIKRNTTANSHTTLCLRGMELPVPLIAVPSINVASLLWESRLCPFAAYANRCRSAHIL